jgi:hypothetical protein
VAGLGLGAGVNVLDISQQRGQSSCRAPAKVFLLEPAITTFLDMSVPIRELSACAVLETQRIVRINNVIPPALA